MVTLSARIPRVWGEDDTLRYLTVTSSTVIHRIRTSLHYYIIHCKSRYVHYRHFHTR